MAKIRIEDIAEEMTLTEEEVKNVVGGWELKNVIVTSYQSSGGGGGMPEETFSLNIMSRRK